MIRKYKNRLAPRPLDKRAKVVSDQSLETAKPKGEDASAIGKAPASRNASQGRKLEYFTAPPGSRAIT